MNLKSSIDNIDFFMLILHVLHLPEYNLQVRYIFFTIGENKEMKSSYKIIFTIYL